MGLLSLGTPLDWEISRKHNEHIRANGIVQLQNIFRQHKSRQNDHFYWGDEVEYMLVHIDEEERRARLAIDKDHILDDLNDPEKPEIFALAQKNNLLFHPEYGRFMIEATPLRPYDGDLLLDYLYVEQNMIKRRQVSMSQLPSNVVPLTLTSFPRMGCGEFTFPSASPIGPASQSLFLPDEIINKHMRFPTLTANIRKRRGHKVSINLPFYPDKNTKLLDDSIPERDLFASDKEPSLGAAKPGHVYMDSMGFGMGSSCLQVTMQAADIEQARYLYDTLAPLTPIMLAVSAAAPIFKGYLVNQDVRWNVISGAVDDRTFAERDVEPYPGFDLFGGLDVADSVKSHIHSLGGGRGVNGDKLANSYGDTLMHTLDSKPIQKIPKSRYASIDTYLSDEKYHPNSPYFKKEYNDLFSPINKFAYDQLISNSNFDEPLAFHFAHLFIRDPLVIFSELIEQNNDIDNDHFENIQLTNWQTLRFKPPAMYSTSLSTEDLAMKPGWRVEFRPMEIQLTDFENAAYSVFLILAGKAMVKYNPDFYISILKIDENMETAHKVDAATKEKFWFKNPYKWRIDFNQFIGYDLSWFDRFIHDGNDLLSSNGVYLRGYCKSNGRIGCEHGENGPNEVRLTADEFINGTECFPGMIRMIVKYVEEDLLPSSYINSSKHCKNDETAQQMIVLKSYLTLISKRASGKIPTIARFLRDLVLKHPSYQRDLKVTESINFDLINASIAITNFELAKEELLREYFGNELFDFLKNRGSMSC